MQREPCLSGSVQLGRLTAYVARPTSLTHPLTSVYPPGGWSFRFFFQMVMPKYEYKCASCGNQFSRVESLSEHAERPVTCPECSSTEVERVFSEFFAKTIRKS